MIESASTRQLIWLRALIGVFLAVLMTDGSIVRAQWDVSGHGSAHPKKDGKNFYFQIDAKTPIKDLLPPPPKERAQKASAFVDDLAKVPELLLTDPFPNRPVPKGIEALVNEDVNAIALQIAKIDLLNRGNTDRFVEALRAERLHLAGLPFQIGANCRLSTVRSRYFRQAVAMVHASLRETEQTLGKAPFNADVELGDAKGGAFLLTFFQECITNDDFRFSSRLKEHQENAIPTRIAAMSQICEPKSDDTKMALAKYLASVSSLESTRALVKTVLFTPEENVRDIAVAALKARREADYTEALLQGFRYPWPDVAKRAAEALVKMNRKDLIPQVVQVLDEADPRAPTVVRRDGKSTTTVRELVRINHHRNCLMCHAPGESAVNNENVLTAEVPLPGEPLPTVGDDGYRNRGFRELLVRIDVTYLRQDFSLMLPVTDAAPWPEMQRFDFVVRTRTLKDDEVQAYQDKFDKLEPGVLPPNHRAALYALRELTGKDTAPTAEAWRKLLKVAK